MMSTKPRFGGSADDFFEELAKARANLEAGVLNDPETLYKFVTKRPDVIRAIRDYEATAADIERQRDDPDFLAMVDQRSAALDKRPSDVTLTGEEFLIATRHLVQ
jgi:hypothetical protein